MNPSLRQLKGFLLVARLGSFTRAAEDMHITQAGLSAMVRDLERQFGCRLFDRTTRSVSLTREGLCLVPSAERVIDEIEGAMASVKLATSASRRVLTIAVTPVFASVLAPQVSLAFARVDRSVEVRIRDVPRQQIQGLVERGEADVGFAIFLKPAAGIELTPLFSFQLMYLAAAGALPDDGPARVSTRKSDAGGRGGGRRSTLRHCIATLPWSNLPPLPLIALSPDTPVQEVIESRLARVRRPLSSGQVCNSMLTMIGMVGAGLGAAILPSMVTPVCPASRFELRRLIGPATQLNFHQIRKKGHRLPPVAEPFLQTMVRVMTDQCERQPT